MALFDVRQRRERDQVAAKNGQDRRGIRASAARLQIGNRRVLKTQIVRRQDWQDEAWDYFDDVGEIKYTARLAGNVMSKLRFFIAVRPPGDEEADPVPASDDGSGIPPVLAARAEAELQRLKSPFGGRAELVRMLYTNLEVAAECYLTCIGPRVSVEVDDFGNEVETIVEEQWEIKSVDEVDITADGVKLMKFPGDTHGLKLDPMAGDAIIRIWERHPRFAYLPDNAMRGVLGICESLVLLENQVKATAKSHASAGIILFPQEMEQLFDERNRPDGDGNDEEGLPSFREAFDDALMEPIENPSSAAAVAPMPLFGPGEVLDKVRHLAFTRPTDAGLDARIEGRVLRMARGLNYPVETVLGHQQTTFANAAVIDEDKFKDHYEPRAVLMCDAWTVGFLQPNLIEAGEDPELVNRLFVWYDPSALLRGVEPHETAKEGWDIGAISDAAWRRVNGWTEEDAPTPVETLLRAVLRLRSLDPGVSTAILELLGVPLDIPQALPGTGPAPAEGTQPPPTNASNGPPGSLAEALLLFLAARQAGKEPGSQVLQRIAAVNDPDVVRAVRRATAADYGRQLMELDRDLRTKVQVAAHNAMHRAIERAGNKLKTQANGTLSKRRTSETSREMIRTCHPRYVAQVMGPTLVEATKLSTSDLVPISSWDALHQQWDEWVAAAQMRALEIVGKIVPLSTDKRAHLAQRQDRHRHEAWTWLEAELQKLAEVRLYQPDPSDVRQGEFDPSASVPVGMVRQAVARAGGATGLAAPQRTVKAVRVDGTPSPNEGRDVFVTLNNGDPTGGIGTGELMDDTLAEGGATTEAYQWDYGPAFRRYPFEDHEDLDGVQFTDWDGPELDASGSWIDSGNFFPGDHDGCACDVIPIILGPDDVSITDTGDVIDQGDSGLGVPEFAPPVEAIDAVPEAWQEALDTFDMDEDQIAEAFDQAQGFLDGSGVVQADALTDPAMDEAVRAYTQEAYVPINDALRAGRDLPESLSTLSGHLDAAIGSGTTTEPFVTFRGMEFGSAVPSEMSTVGSTFVDNGYVSTSMFRSPAAEFGDWTAQITVPPGSNALFVNYDAAGYAETAEVLLGRGSQFTVTDVDSVAKTIRLRLEP